MPFRAGVYVTERDAWLKPPPEISGMAPKSRHRKRPTATKSSLLKASGAHRGGHDGPSCAHTTTRRPCGLRALCGAQHALEEFVACHDACAVRTAAKPLADFAVVHYVRCCSELSATDASRVANRAAIAKLRTVALSTDWAEGGYRLSVLLVERYARHANSVSSAFFEGRCSLAMLVDTLDRLSRFKDWTAMRDDELGISDSVVPDLLGPWFCTDPLTWPQGVVGPIFRIATRYGLMCWAIEMSVSDDPLGLGAMVPKIAQLLPACHADMDTLEALKCYMQMLDSTAGLDSTALMAQLAHAMIVPFQPALDAIEEDLSMKAQSRTQAIRGEWLAAFARSARFGRLWPRERRKLACEQTRRRFLPSGIDCYNLMRYLRHILTTLALVAPLERQRWRLYANAYKVFSLGLDAWPFRHEPWWKVYRFRVFTGGWIYHDVQLLFCRYTAWFALLCSEQAAADALELLRHHRMIPERHIKLIRSLARQGPNEQLRAVAEVFHQDMLEGMEEEGLTDDLEDPFA